MTTTLINALKAVPGRSGPVVVDDQGQAVTETYLKHVVYKVCSDAGLAPASWHALRHTYATHAARFGVNSWALQSWLPPVLA